MKVYTSQVALELEILKAGLWEHRSLLHYSVYFYKLKNFMLNNKMRENDREKLKLLNHYFP